MPPASFSHVPWAWGHLWMLCELSFFWMSDSSSECNMNALPGSNTSQPVSSVINCVFDDGLCSFCNEGFISWTSEKGYIEARNNINKNQKFQAILQSQLVQLGFDPWCLHTEIRLEGEAQLFIAVFNGTNSFSSPRVDVSGSESFNSFPITVYTTNVNVGKLNHTLILEPDTIAHLRSITIEEGSCAIPGNCLATSKIENCPWTSTNSTVCQWDSGNKYKNFLGPAEDHTTDGNNIYFWMNLSALISGESCSLQSVLSRKAEAGDEGCLRFWYHMDGEGDDSLSVSILSGSLSPNEKVLWTKSSDDTKAVWSMGAVKIESVLPFKVQFTGTRGTLGNFSSVALDDIEFTYASDCEDTESSHNGRGVVVIASCVAAVVVVIVFISFIIYKMRKNRELTLPSISEPPLPLEEIHSASDLSSTADRLPIAAPEQSLYDEIIVDHPVQDPHIYSTLQECSSPPSAQLPRAPSDDTNTFTEMRVRNSGCLSPQVTDEDTHLKESSHSVVDVNNFDEIEHQNREDEAGEGYEVAKTTESCEYNHLCCEAQVVVQEGARHIFVKKVGDSRVETRVTQSDDNTNHSLTENHSPYMVPEVTDDWADELTNETEEDRGYNKQQHPNGDMEVDRRLDADTYNHLFDKAGEQITKPEGISEILQFQDVNTRLPYIAIEGGTLCSDNSTPSESLTHAPSYELKKEEGSRDVEKSVNEVPDGDSYSRFELSRCGDQDHRYELLQKPGFVHHSSLQQTEDACCVSRLSDDSHTVSTSSSSHSNANDMELDYFVLDDQMADCDSSDCDLLTD